MNKINLSVIVPVYNESRTVKELLEKLVKVSEVREIVVVDDGSTDNTAKQIKKVKSTKIRYFFKKNEGKGSAVCLGLKKVKGNYCLIQDADLEYDPEDIPALLEPIQKKNMKVVYGSRFLGPHSNLLFWHKVGNTLLNFTVNILFNTTLSDMETCYKVLPTNLFRQLNIKSKNFDLEPEITCKILKRGIRIFEVPISYVGRDFSQGKKITWRDGIHALVKIIRLRF